MNVHRDNDRLTDAEFLDALANRSLSRFSHRDHLRMAFVYVRRDGLDGLAVSCRDSIKLIAAAHGEPDRYHETRTSAWASLVATAAIELPAATFEQLLAARPDLMRSDLLERYYSAERLNSQGARIAWTEPDRQPLPGPRLSGRYERAA
ncbi:MAG: hypothetical protein ACXVSL_22960 [Solirubrobacteraceae bacterium]